MSKDLLADVVDNMIKKPVKKPYNKVIGGWDINYSDMNYSYVDNIITNSNQYDRVLCFDNFYQDITYLTAHGWIPIRSGNFEIPIVRNITAE